MTKIKVTIEDQRLVINKSCVSHNAKTNKGTLLKLHRKVKQNEKECSAQNLGSTAKVKVIKDQRFVTYKLCVHKINSKTAEVNLIKFNTMVKHIEKVCCAQNLGPPDQGHGYRHRFIPHKSSLRNNSKRAKQI